MFLKNKNRLLCVLISLPAVSFASANCWNGSGTQFNFGTVTQGQTSTTTGKVVFTCNNYEGNTRFIRACLRLQDEAPLAMRTNSTPANVLYFNIYPLNNQSIPLSRSTPQYAQLDYRLPNGATQEAYFNLAAKIAPKQMSLAAWTYYNYGFMTVIKYMVAQQESQLLSCEAMPETNIRIVQSAATADVKQGCQIENISDMNFGSLSPVSGQKLSAKTTARISATCPTGTAFSLGLGQGLHFKENSRQLCSDTNCVSYQLYQDATYSTAWGDTLHHNTVDKVSSDGQSQQVVVYGAIPPQEWPPSGKYTDTVVVTLFY